MALIRLYQKYLSPLQRGPVCRFTPSCSAYALEAFEKRGFFVGFALMVWRLLRCSPLSPGGYDPVPETGFHTLPFRWSKYTPPPEQQDEASLSDTKDEDGQAGDFPGENQNQNNDQGA